MPETIIPQAFPGWEVRERLGHGAYGQVFKCVKQEYSTEMKAAIKVITIPKDETELSERAAEGMDQDAIYNYYKGLVDDCIREIKVMADLKSAANVVSIDDFKVVEKTDSLGWYVLIRMELLQGFSAYAKNRRFTEQEVIRLGIDICSALEVCHKQHIIHRDIKPANIMVSDFGDFKLGDFGIARKLQQGMGYHLSSKGTQAFMAPEVPKHKPYDERVDIYSLGLVLYQLVNNGRPPFVDPAKPQITYEDKEQAIYRRFQGERIPPPPFAGPALSSVILRACHYLPQGRFASAAEMKQALEQAQRNPNQPVIFRPVPAVQPVNRPRVAQQPGGYPAGPQNGGVNTNAVQPVGVQTKKNSSNGFLAVGVIAIVCVIALVTAMIVYLVRENQIDAFVPKTMYAVSEKTDVLSEPSAGSDVIDTVPAGFFVYLSGDAKGSYIKIEYRGQPGWVKYRCLEDCSGDFIWNTVGHNGVDSHEAPDINSKRGERFPEGMPVTIEGKVTNGYVFASGTLNGEHIEGWIDAKYILTQDVS